MIKFLARLIETIFNIRTFQNIKERNHIVALNSKLMAQEFEENCRQEPGVILFAVPLHFNIILYKRYPLDSILDAYIDLLDVLEG